MAFLTINGVTVAIENDSVNKQVLNSGSEYQTENGSLVVATRKKMATYSFTSSVLTVPEMQALKQWIFGQNISFEFEDTAYSKFTGYGLDPDAADPDITYSTTNPKYTGKNFAVIGNAATVECKFDVTFMNWKKYEPYTVAVFVQPAASPAWGHYAVKGYLGAPEGSGATLAASTTATPFFNGSQQLTLQRNYGYPLVTTSGSKVYLQNVYQAAGATVSNSRNIEELVLFKGAHLTTTMINALRTRTAPLLGLPFVEMSGDVVNGETVNVVGRCDNEEFFSIHGGEQRGRLSFSLIEMNQNNLEVLT